MDNFNGNALKNYKDLLEKKFKSYKKFFFWDMERRNHFQKEEIENILNEEINGEDIFIRIELFQKIEEEFNEEFQILQHCISSSLGIHFGSKIIYLDRE